MNEQQRPSKAPQRRLGTNKHTSRAGQTKKVRMKRTPVAKEPANQQRAR